MRCAQQPTASVVEKLVGLIVHFHGYMRAAIQIGVDLAFKADGECAAVFSGEANVEGNRASALDQIRARAQLDSGIV